MRTGNPKPGDEKVGSVVDGKAGPVIGVARQIALSLAAISIALAALCLALLSFTSAQNRPNDPFFNKAIPVILVVLGTVFVLACALSIDWVIDKFRDEDWKVILGRETVDSNWDQFDIRLSLFNSGYFLMCVCVAVLSFVILLQGLYKLASPQTEMFTLSLIFSGLWSLYIVFQMMTKKSGKIIFALIALGVVIGSVVITILT